MQRLEGEFLRHFSKAEKLSMTVTVIFVLFIGGYFLGQNSWRPAYTVEVSGLAPTQAEASEGTDATGETMIAAQDGEDGTSQVNLININTATEEELTSLPGIGATRAAAIVAYRQEHGGFRMVEELTDVSGIGEGILAQVIDKITVGDEGESKDGENTGG